MIDTIAPLAAFLGGVFTLFAPCSIMLLPAFFAYAFTSKTTLLARTGIFWLGLLTVLVPMGAAAGTAGAFLRDHMTVIMRVGGVCVAVFGILQILAVEITPRRRKARGFARNDTAHPLSIYILGMTYGVAGVGCAGPILGAVLLVAGFSGDPLSAGFHMVLYATGMAAPLGLLAALWTGANLSQRAWLRPRPVTLLGRHTTLLNIVSGGIFFALGAALVFFGVSNPLGGLVGSERLAAWEQHIIAVANGIPAWVVIVGLGTLGAGGVLVFLSRRRNAQKANSEGSGTDPDNPPVTK
ncbi:cytochrome c biogenesis protein CcdA [Schaalia sp. ZJ405]|uniref:cytochrome c biogenesis CcdA family protein n=1 Tax=Schaalia sp. ZJ405 TaxID=2709403 RepID=UPI0013EB1446|nr:cytochrome c biogenesis CcdA family protein [Schaalia sp. ZJ405]QPK80923.1 cytochrome c biogenesis protein CcdA [Schaalia sp. ZJ405]